MEYGKNRIDYYNFLNHEKISENNPIPSSENNIIAETPNPLLSQKIQNEELKVILEQLNLRKRSMSTNSLNSLIEIKSTIKKKKTLRIMNPFDFDKKEKKIKEINFSDFEKIKKKNEELKKKLEKIEFEIDLVKLKKEEKILVMKKNENITKDKIEKDNKLIFLERSKIWIDEKVNIFLLNLEIKRIQNLLEEKNLEISEIQKEKNIFNNQIKNFLFAVENERLQKLFYSENQNKKKLLDIIKKLRDMAIAKNSINKKNI